MHSLSGRWMSTTRQPAEDEAKALPSLGLRERLLALAWGLALLALLGIYPLAHPIVLTALGLGLLSLGGLAVLPALHRPRFYLASLLALAAVGTLTHIRLPAGSSSLVIEIVSVVVPLGVMFGDVRRDQMSSATLLLLAAVLAITSAMLSENLNRAIHSAAWSAGVIFAVATIIGYQTRQRDLAEASLQELRKRAFRDGLTGLLNRQGWDHDAPQIVAQAFREQRPLTVAMIDADHLKPLNDRHGHATGDAALRLIADRLTDICRRPLDVAARLGGDEFAVIWFDTGPEQGQAMAEALCAAIARSPVDHDGVPVPITLSVGLCHCVPDRRDALEQALMSADRALYRAKAEGRDRVASKIEVAPPKMAA